MPMDMVQAVTLGIASGEFQLLTGTVSDTLADTNQDKQTISGGGTPRSPDQQEQQQPQ